MIISARVLGGFVTFLEFPKIAAILPIVFFQISY